MQLDNINIYNPWNAKTSLTPLQVELEKAETASKSKLGSVKLWLSQGF